MTSGVVETLVRKGTSDSMSGTEMSFGRLIHGFSGTEKQLIRKIEKLLYKYNSAVIAEKFNKICLNEGLLPK